MSLSRFENRVVTATLDESAMDIARKMRDGRVGCVVITRSSRPIGIVTDRDLALRVVAEGKDARTTSIADIVTYDATTIPRDAGIETAVHTMRECGVRRLPIVDNDGVVTGIVTADDLTILLARELGDLGEGLNASVNDDANA